jgi:hypothetical protein
MGNRVVHAELSFDNGHIEEDFVIFPEAFNQFLISFKITFPSSSLSGILLTLIEKLMHR